MNFSLFGRNDVSNRQQDIPVIVNRTAAGTVFEILLAAIIITVWVLTIMLGSSMHDYIAAVVCTAVSILSAFMAYHPTSKWTRNVTAVNGINDLHITNKRQALCCVWMYRAIAMLIILIGLFDLLGNHTVHTKLFDTIMVVGIVILVIAVIALRFVFHKL